MITTNVLLTGYFIPLVITLFTFRKEPKENLRIIYLIALCPGINIIGFVFSLFMGAKILHEKGYLPISDD
jgi:hypothetical protein